VNEQTFNPQEMLGRVVDRAAELVQYGSFSQRNPTLGKMVRCPFCRTRKRRHEACCNAKYVAGTMTNVMPKPKGRSVPRLTRKNPPLFQMRQILLDIERNPEIAIGMQVEMLSRIGRLPREVVKNEETREQPRQEITVKPEHMAAFVERYLTWKMKRAKKKIRSQQKLSRRINRRKP
jgi:hypothetical protein